MVFEFFESPCHLWFIDGWLKCRTRSSQCVQHNETEYWIEEDSINDRETGKQGKRSSAEKGPSPFIYVTSLSQVGGNSARDVSKCLTIFQSVPKCNLQCT